MASDQSRGEGAVEELDHFPNATQYVPEMRDVLEFRLALHHGDKVLATSLSNRLQALAPPGSSISNFPLYADSVYAAAELELECSRFDDVSASMPCWLVHFSEYAPFECYRHIRVSSTCLTSALWMDTLQRVFVFDCFLHESYRARAAPWALCNISYQVSGFALLSISTHWQRRLQCCLPEYSSRWVQINMHLRLPERIFPTSSNMVTAD